MKPAKSNVRRMRAERSERSRRALAKRATMARKLEYAAKREARHGR